MRQRVVDALRLAAPHGPWTAAIAVARSYGWADAVPLGDYHLPHAVAWALAGQARGSDERMVSLLEPFRGHRWRVLQLIGAAGIVVATLYIARRESVLGRQPTRRESPS